MKQKYWTTTTSNSDNILTLEKLEKMYEEAMKIPQPTGYKLVWHLAFRRKFPWLRLMRIAKWTYEK